MSGKRVLLREVVQQTDENQVAMRVAFAMGDWDSTRQWSRYKRNRRSNGVRLKTQSRLLARERREVEEDGKEMRRRLRESRMKISGVVCSSLGLSVASSRCTVHVY